MLSNGSLKGLVIFLKRYLTFIHQNPIAHNNMGHAMPLTGDTASAIEHFKRAVHLKPLFAEAHKDMSFAFKVLTESDASIKP